MSVIGEHTKITLTGLSVILGVVVGGTIWVTKVSIDLEVIKGQLVRIENRLGIPSEKKGFFIKPNEAEASDKQGD